MKRNRLLCVFFTAAFAPALLTTPAGAVRERPSIGPEPVQAQPKVQDNTFTAVRVLPGQFQEKQVVFQQGKRLVITMVSDVSQPNTDVDLYVYRGAVGQNILALDASIGPNGRVEFVVPATGPYRVRVINLGPGIANTSIVTITEK